MLETTRWRAHHFYTGHGMSIGSETNGNVEFVQVIDLTIDGADNGIRVKSNSTRCGFVRNVSYEDVCIRNAKEPIVIDPFDNGEALYVDKVEPQKSVRLSSAVGRRSPAYCTAVGKAILAHLPAEEVTDSVIRFGLERRTKCTITTPAELHADLAATRSRGYAIDNEENEEGVRCIGAAVLDCSGRPIAAISVSGPAFSITKEKLTAVSGPVIAAAQALSSELGYSKSR